MINYTRNLLLHYTKPVAEIILAVFACLVQFANFFNISNRKFDQRMRFFLCLPAFFDFVLDIVVVSTQKQVQRVYTQCYIAFVKHTQSIWNWAKMQQPRNSMCENVFPVILYFAITVKTTATTTGPKPTLWPFLNFWPKSFSQCFSFVYSYRHVLVLQGMG